MVLGTTISTIDRGHDGNELSLDAGLELLANRQRRVLLGFFCDSNREVASIDELVTEIIDEEATITGSARVTILFRPRCTMSTVILIHRDRFGRRPTDPRGSML